tara:strand:+ start:120 stop:779 length:660 start_codon:yes stop_codon:yes gene_type:complete
MQFDDCEELVELVKSTRSLYILGAGLNDEKPAHRAVHDLAERGWNPIPVHPRDAGGSIGGFPIRPDTQDRTNLGVVVLFLAPSRSREVVKKMLIANAHPPTLIWFQIGAEDDMALSWLEEAGWDYVQEDCIVRFAQRRDLNIANNPLPWFKQIQDEDQSGCSIWCVHEFGEDSDKGTAELEWIGDLSDLEESSKAVPTYIRSLKLESESLEQCARRLAK